MTQTSAGPDRHRKVRILTIAAVALGMVVAAVVVTVWVRGPGMWFGRDCTAVGGIDLVRVTMPNDGASHLQTIELELSQGDQRSAIKFPAQPDQRHGSRGFIPPGIDVRMGTERVYVVPLSGLSPAWRPTPDDRARLSVVGIGGAGQPGVQATDSFTFDKWYPNGKQCDAASPTIKHTTVLTDADLVKPAA